MRPVKEQDQRKKKYGRGMNISTKLQRFGEFRYETLHTTRNAKDRHLFSSYLSVNNKIYSPNGKSLRRSMLQKTNTEKASGKIYATKRKSSIAKLNDTWNKSDRKFLRANYALSTGGVQHSKVDLHKEICRKSNPRVEFHMPANGRLAQDDEVPDERTINSGPKHTLVDGIPNSNLIDFGKEDMLRTQQFQNEHSKVLICPENNLNKKSQKSPRYINEGQSQPSTTNTKDKS